MSDITGTTGDDTLVGTPGDERIFGLEGNDTLDGVAGNDELDGGDGDDTYFVRDSDTVLVEALNHGRDVVYASVSFNLTPGAYVEFLSAASIGGTEALNFGGNAFDNNIFGNYGSNILAGGGGADVLAGFGGDDIYYITDGRERVIENPNEGRDIIYASLGYNLAAGTSVEILSAANIAGTQAMNFGGNEFNNEIYGNYGENILIGGGGADVLAGFGGDDIYYVTDGRERIIETANQGRDIIYTNQSYNLAAGTSIEILSAADIAGTATMNLGGNEFNNEIYGNYGSNILIGGGGADVLAGFGGDDIYYVTDGRERIIETANQGRDIIYTNLNYNLAAGTSIEIVSAADISATTVLNLGGNELTNEIYGNYGANILAGGGGADVLAGFGGDDTYYVTDGRERIIETANQGRDVVYTSVNFTLTDGSFIEVLATASGASGTDALNLGGNGFSNEIYGNAAINIIDGGLGADYLVGGGAADQFAFTTALGSGNVDTIADFAPGTDKILLGGNAGEPFVLLASGTLAAGAFVVGGAALDASDVILYNSATGALSYDADGNGGGAAVQFATLATGLSLTAADFLVSGPANHAPAINSGATASVAENSAATTIVYQTAATDSDGDRITYTLSGADAALLNIDASGAVRLNSPADFETKNSYSFTVTASDSGSSTAKAVTITITDVSEGPPTPIINEVSTANDDVLSAQTIDRNVFTISQNPNLPDQALPSATIQGSISVNADHDFFAIHLEKGEKLILDVDATTNSLDTHIHVYDAAGNEFGDNDDQGDFDPGSSPPFDHNTDSFASFRAPAAGTYYFSIESFDNSSNGNYQINVSIAPPGTQAQIIEEDIQALLSGSRWNVGHTALTYGFPTAASQYPGTSFHEVQPATEFSAFNAAQIAGTQSLLQMVQNVTGLTFTQDSATPGNADLRYAMSTDPDVEVAYAYYPTNAGPTSVGGTAWFNTVDFNAPKRGNYAWMGILHESGHALGLKHGHEMPALSPDRDSIEYSVMTYRSYPGASLDGYVVETWGYAQTPMMYDIAALQRLYGANFTFNSTDSVYSWSPTTGEMSINGVGQGAPGDGDGTTLPSENRILMTVWDGGGNDTYDLHAYATSTTIDLRPGEWTTTSSTQLSNLSAHGGGGTHFARGNIANALLYNGNTASLIENAIGGAGDDTIIANQGANHLTGNGGADLFTWADTASGGTGASADTIMDFVRGADRIDLSRIDTNPATPTDDPFAFLGTGAFTNHAGEVRYDVTGGAAHVFVDFDGNGVADMEIIVNNNTILASSDFVL